jgi:adenine-specific DNA-methyltransferase
VSPPAAGIRSEAELLGIAHALTGEPRSHASGALIARVRSEIENGGDPLGEAFCALRTPAARRPSGAVYSPSVLVEAMLERAAAQAEPARVVDAGAGSGRFLLAAARRFPSAQLVAVETDPLALALLRANLAVRGLSRRAEILCLDYRLAVLSPLAERTLFIGNPPYVRHHQIAAPMKAWLRARAAELGFAASQLAGLHAHFLLATALHARAGDAGVLVTSAEWLDVRYGRLMRELLSGPLGLLDLHLLESSARVFDDADTTAVVMAFEVGARPVCVKVRKVHSLAALAPLSGGEAVKRERFVQASRWTTLVREPSKIVSDAPELGEFFAVHRGQVTGKNQVWIAGSHSAELPRSVLFPSVTRARELIQAGSALTSLAELREVIDLPPELDALDPRQRRSVERFLLVARRMGAHEGFIARHRKSWWSVGLRKPAPILVTYMARRPPAFVHNAAGARHLNIAHGLYPRAPLPATSLARIARHLSAHTPQSSGRTYAGGLTKFEPSELLCLRIPGLAELVSAGERA